MFSLYGSHVRYVRMIMKSNEINSSGQSKQLRSKSSNQSHHSPTPSNLNGIRPPAASDDGLANL